MSAVKPIPEGYHTVTPYLVVPDAADTLRFAEQVFDARLIHRMDRPDGGVWHAEMQIGDSRVMLSDANEQYPAQRFMLYVYVPDVDATYQRALRAGGRSEMEPADQFWGDRHGAVRDAAGNVWTISTHVEDVAPEEMERRQREYRQRAAQQADAATPTPPPA